MATSRGERIVWTIAPCSPTRHRARPLGSLGTRSASDSVQSMTSREARASPPPRLNVTFVSASVTNPWARLDVVVPSSAWDGEIRDPLHDGDELHAVGAGQLLGFLTPRHEPGVADRLPALVDHDDALAVLGGDRLGQPRPGADQDGRERRTLEHGGQVDGDAGPGPVDGGRRCSVEHAGQVALD